MTKRLKNMLRLSVIWPIVLVLLAAGIVIADQSKVVLVGGGQAYKPLADFVLESESPTVAGDSWYVDSGKTASGDGKSWDYAVITLNEAIDLCTADNGDVIHVAPGHAETITSAAIVVPDVAGITVIGYGEGLQRPTFTWATGTAASFAVSGADFVLKNMRFDGSSDVATVAMFTITAAGFQFIGNEVIVADATEQATLVFTGDADADRMKIIGNRIYGTTDAGNASVLAFSGAASDIEVAYNHMETTSSDSSINTISVVTQVNIHHNYIKNTSTGKFAIEFDGNATGVISYNQVVTDVFATAIDPGYCDVFETYWADDGAHDVLATEVLTHEDGNVLWSATERAVLESEANDALVDEDLDHFVKETAGGSTTAYPSNVTNYSILGYIMGQDGDVTGFDEDTDSLEAIGNQLLGVDHFITATAGGSTTAYPSDVTQYSQLGYVLGIDGDPAGYDEATDSLEALGDQVADTNLELMANNALVDEGLDHMITAASGGATTAYPENVTQYSVISYMLAVDADPTGYDEATHSLEAIGDQVTDVNLELMANNALVDEDLDHFIKATAGGSTTAYPSNVTDYSILAYVMAQDGAVADYDEDTDSLEAISDKITTGTDTLSGIQLDHFVYGTAGGSTTAYPDNVTQYSQLGYILGKDGDATGYDEDSDSLEALGDQVADSQIQANVTASIEADDLDHFIKAAAGGATTAYPSDVTDYSILAYIMAQDGAVADFDEDTDSLEAIGTDTDAIIADTEDIQSMVARCATRTSDALPQTGTETIFNVATGPVRVLELVGEVTTVIGATATNLKISIDPTTGAASDMATNLAIASLLDGSTMTMTGGFGSILINNATGGGDGMSVPYIVPIGIITITTSAGVGGEIAWFIRYEPMTPGATVTADGP